MAGGPGPAAFSYGADEVRDGGMLGPGRGREILVNAVDPGVGLGAQDSQPSRRLSAAAQNRIRSGPVAGDPDPVVLLVDDV